MNYINTNAQNIMDAYRNGEANVDNIVELMETNGKFDTFGNHDAKLALLSVAGVLPVHENVKVRCTGKDYDTQVGYDDAGNYTTPYEDVIWKDIASMAKIKNSNLRRIVIDAKGRTFSEIAETDSTPALHDADFFTLILDAVCCDCAEVRALAGYLCIGRPVPWQILEILASDSTGIVRYTALRCMDAYPADYPLPVNAEQIANSVNMPFEGECITLHTYTNEVAARLAWKVMGIATPQSDLNSVHNLAKAGLDSSNLTDQENALSMLLHTNKQLLDADCRKAITCAILAARRALRTYATD